MLHKDICKSCREHGKEWLPWQSADDDAWSDGFVYCIPHEGWINFNKMKRLPEKCDKKLEQCLSCSIL